MKFLCTSKAIQATQKRRIYLKSSQVYVPEYNLDNYFRVPIFKLTTCAIVCNITIKNNLLTKSLQIMYIYWLLVWQFTIDRINITNWLTSRFLLRPENNGTNNYIACC
jgi:hypothetical protein